MTPATAGVLAALSVPISTADLRQALGDERVAPRITGHLTAYELLDHICLVIEGEPACFEPQGWIGTPETNATAVWSQRPINGVVGCVGGWAILLTRGSYRRTDIASACDNFHGSILYLVAGDVFGLSPDLDDEEGLWALLGSSWPGGVEGRATAAVSGIRRRLPTQIGCGRGRSLLTPPHPPWLESARSVINGSCRSVRNRMAKMSVRL